MWRLAYHTCQKRQCSEIQIKPGKVHLLLTRLSWKFILFLPNFGKFVKTILDIKTLKKPACLFTTNSTLLYDSWLEQISFLSFLFEFKIFSSIKATRFNSLRITSFTNTASLVCGDMVHIWSTHCSSLGSQINYSPAGLILTVTNVPTFCSSGIMFTSSLCTHRPPVCAWWQFNSLFLN